MPVRKIDVDLDARVETGAVQFGDDYPGLFIRGDDCAALLGAIRAAMYDARKVQGSGNWAMLLYELRSLEKLIQHDVLCDMDVLGGGNELDNEVSE